MSPRISHKPFFQHASDIARFYGFLPFTDLLKTAEKQQKNKIAVRVSKSNEHSITHSERFQLLREFLSSPLTEIRDPHLIQYSPGTTPIARQKLKRFGIEVLRSGSSVAEAIVIQVAMAILQEAGYRDIFVDINSIGNKDSRERFLRDVSNYYRSNIHLLPTECKDLLRRDIYQVLCYNHEACQELREEAPKPMNYLTEGDRQHFKQVLEYLEYLNVPYRVNNVLANDPECYTQTVFEIHSGNPDTLGMDEPLTAETLLARGGRYDELPRRIGYRKNIPAVGASLFTDSKAFTGQKISPKKLTTNDPRVFLIQIGFDAKLVSMQVLEELRHAHIPVYQLLNRDRIGVQLQTAERMGVPYIMIIGQKEANERTILVRDMESRSQQSIPLSGLCKFLKKVAR